MLTVPNAFQLVFFILDDSFTFDNFATHIACINEHGIWEEVSTKIVRFSVEKIAFVDSIDIKWFTIVPIDFESKIFVLQGFN